MRLTAQRRQSGDTIIEVLIVLTVLSTAFALAYSTATRSLAGARQAQEHSEALQFVSSQVELLRSADPATSGIYKTGPGVGSFCMTGTTAKYFASGYSVPAGAADTDFAKYPDECTRGVALEEGGRGLYHLSVNYSPAPVSNRNKDLFTLIVRWQGPGTMGIQQEKIIYKLHP